MKEQDIKSKRPPYLIGLLCLLPLIGAFVGIALILYGIFKYRDKWLIIIGSAGLIITIAAYSFLFYNLKYGKETSKGFAKISQMELNSLIKNIEFYKIEKGKYPDSLEELRVDDKMIIIEDPLLTRKMNDNIKSTFQYQKIGSGYTLFSVGIDEIPNTIDDIYPNISDKDERKFGSIRSSSHIKIEH
jgi:hypothetical protein